MAVQAIVDAWVHGEGYDFTTDTNQAAIAAEVAILDATVFGDGGWTTNVPGLKSAMLDLSGFWQAGDDAIDPVLWANLGVDNKVFTLGPDEVEGAPAYIVSSFQDHYEVGGTIGELTPYTLHAGQAAGGYGVQRGMLAKAKGTVSATGAIGSPVQLGAASSDQYVYAVLHVFEAGTTITVKVQSDSASNFPSATDVATIGPITTTGATLVRVAGPVTDTWYRFLVSAITGSFVVAGSIAVQ